MTACDFSHVISKGVSGIRIDPRDITWIFAKTVAVRGASIDLETRELAAEAVLKQADSDAGSALPGSRVTQRDVVGGIANHEFIQKSGRDSGRQARQHAHTRTDKLSLDRGEIAHTPQRSGNHCLPGIVDKMEARSYPGRKVVVDLD